jgi:DNA-binding MarR family transcriptional regulator
MSNDSRRSLRIDVVLIVIAIVVLSASIWTWIAAMPIARDLVFLATTIALVISLVLVVNVVVLVLFRLQRRITHLEGVLQGNDSSTSTQEEDKVLVVTLTNKERRILNRLEECGGQMNQDELRRVTGMSKSTLSVTLSALERKSLISREAMGRSKVVTLEKQVTR